mmetsp:Transcript_39642/g.91502  ORF Transcript_39642/g.91502 Transcript_39642/m.91502 type:complete len:233 (-) Transcript_39642:2359-3057(-)
MAFQWTPVTAPWKHAVALARASTTQGFLFKVLHATDEAIFRRMFPAPQVQRLCNTVSRFELAQDSVPLIVLLKLRRIAKNVHAMSCPGQRHNDPILNGAEAQLLWRVAADEGQHHDIVLFALVVVNRDNTDARDENPAILFALAFVFALPFLLAFAFAFAFPFTLSILSLRPILDIPINDPGTEELAGQILLHLPLLAKVRRQQGDAAFVHPIHDQVLCESAREHGLKAVDL